MKSKSRKNTVLIEKYLEGKLKGEKLKDFELRLKTDKEFAQEYFLQKTIIEVIQDQEILDLRMKLDKIAKEHRKKSRK